MAGVLVYGNLVLVGMHQEHYQRQELWVIALRRKGSMLPVVLVALGLIKTLGKHMVMGVLVVPQRSITWNIVETREVLEKTALLSSHISVKVVNV